MFNWPSFCKLGITVLDRSEFVESVEIGTRMKQTKHGQVKPQVRQLTAVHMYSDL